MRGTYLALAAASLAAGPALAAENYGPVQRDPQVRFRPVEPGIGRIGVVGVSALVLHGIGLEDRPFDVLRQQDEDRHRRVAEGPPVMVMAMPGLPSGVSSRTASPFSSVGSSSQSMHSFCHS